MAAAARIGHFARCAVSITESKMPAGSQIDKPDPGIVQNSSVIAAAAKLAKYRAQAEKKDLPKKPFAAIAIPQSAGRIMEANYIITGYFPAISIGKGIENVCQKTMGRPILPGGYQIARHFGRDIYQSAAVGQQPPNYVVPFKVIFGCKIPVKRAPFCGRLLLPSWTKLREHAFRKMERYESRSVMHSCSV